MLKQSRSDNIYQLDSLFLSYFCAYRYGGIKASLFRVSQNAMKYAFIILCIFSFTSCTFNEFRTGQRFEEESPDFYMSIAPSFSEPYEYEIHYNNLFYREYNGLGGYDWGRAQEVSKVEITLEQMKHIRELAITAIKESIEEQLGHEILVMDGVSWYLITDFGLGPFLAAKTNNPSDSFYQLRNYLNELLPNT